jgi:hypothetical protein
MLPIAGKGPPALLIEGEIVRLPSCRFSGCLLSLFPFFRMGTYEQLQLFVGESF